MEEGRSSSIIRHYGRTIFVSLLISFSLVYLVLREMDLDETKKILVDWNWGYVPVLLLLAVSKNLARALRLHVMHPEGASRQVYFYAVCAQNLFFLTLPAVLGEMSLVYILRKVLNLNLYQSMTNVAVVRLFDISIYLIFSSVIVIVTWTDDFGTLTRGLVFLTIALALIVAVVHFFMKLDQQAATKIRIVIFAIKQSEMFRSALHNLSSKKILIQIAGYSVINYILNIAIFIVTLRLFYEQLSMLGNILLNIFVTPIFLLPVKGIANIGTHEAAYFYGLQLLSVSNQSAVGIALGTHAADIARGLTMTLAGIVGLLVIAWRNRLNRVDG